MNDEKLTCTIQVEAIEIEDVYDTNKLEIVISKEIIK